MVLNVLARAIAQGKEIKGIQIGNEELRLFVCRLHIFYVENYKDYTHSISEWILQNIRIQNQNTKISGIFIHETVRTVN